MRPDPQRLPVIGEDGRPLGRVSLTVFSAWADRNMSGARVAFRAGRARAADCADLRARSVRAGVPPADQNGAPAIYTRSSLLRLTLAHLQIVLLAAAASTVVAVVLGVFVTRPAGAEFLPLSRTLADIGQTFPPIAVLALAVPIVGFGETPTFIALFLYGLLPIFENTMTGLTQVPAGVLDAAPRHGHDGRQRLLQIELPLALPVILAGHSSVARHQPRHRHHRFDGRRQGARRSDHRRADQQQHRLCAAGGLIVALLAMLLFDAMVALERWRRGVWASRRLKQRRP